ncbi:hypothetical protein [Micromonospora sp. HUAS LYJ1]|uniref:hypothetical protein n=1 Tax=Micromonospora sp. HUAS LYJ1 TaxID=3061626 RepID=UPI0026739F77|nr:hypothetical protein [Micromonospora sp. HUAS LYJ1]WKU04265.1 hypothetical protein Q2K16_26165 [Micromonospora sp. HUAS LYJ1]
MTSPAEPASHDASQARQITAPLRELAALVLLGANAVLLFVGFVRLLVPTSDYSTFSGRAGSEFFAFVGVESTVLPLLAVLLVTHLSPVSGRARQFTQIAIGEYAFAALFGVLTFLIWLVGRLAEAEVLDALLGMLTRAAWFALFGVAAFVVYRIWRTLYHVPKPKPQPGVYGQPQPGWGQPQGGYPGAGYPGQPGAGQYGQPGFAPPQSAPPFGTPQSAPPFGAPQSAPPAGAAPQSAPPFGAPQSAPPFGAPQSAPPFGAPQSAPPFGAPQSAPPFGAPQSAPPFGAPQPGPSFGAPQFGPPVAPPFGQPPSADPTQAIPRQPGEPTTGPADTDGDRTRTFRHDDPNTPH